MTILLKYCDGVHSYDNLESAQAKQAEIGGELYYPMRIEWSGDVGACGRMSLFVWQIPESDEWQWDIQYQECRTISYGIEPTRDDAVNAAETFVKQLVMGVPT